MAGRIESFLLPCHWVILLDLNPRCERKLDCVTCTYPAMREQPPLLVSSRPHCCHSKIYVLDSEFRWGHDRTTDRGSIMDVGDWLRSLGLAQYEAIFRESDIDAEVLRELSESDLERLGVSLGHRKRLLKAIANLGATESLAKPANPAPTSPSTDAAERRQLTVMFCDLVGSTALSSRLDPEDMRRVIRAYQDACSGVVARYDGFVAKFMGDGVLAYFGFPRAHEDDAARAVHAGLELAQVVVGLETPASGKLAARIGVATGLVVIGDVVGQGAAQEQAVVGDTPNLAARLQGLADAGGVVISTATRRLVGDRFRLKDLGKHAVKASPSPSRPGRRSGSPRPRAASRPLIPHA
jgi:class 3 adenylate cyclase